MKWDGGDFEVHLGCAQGSPQRFIDAMVDVNDTFDIAKAILYDIEAPIEVLLPATIQLTLAMLERNRAASVVVPRGDEEA